MDVTIYHNKKESGNQLLTCSISIDPAIDGKLMQITNQLIREGWELVYIKESKYQDIHYAKYDFVFHRFIEV